MENITLQKATIADLETFLELEKSVADSKYYSAITDKDEARKEFQESEICFIKKDEAIVGSIYYQFKNPDHVYLSGFVIKPEFQHQGIGREALTQILQKLNRVKRIEAVTHPDNPALELYQSLGFEIRGQKENYFGDGEPQVVLAKTNEN